MEDINALPDQLNESRDQGDNSLMTDMTELEVVTHTADLQDLSLSQKIVKALALAHLGLHRGIEQEAAITASSADLNRYGQTLDDCYYQAASPYPYDSFILPPMPASLPPPISLPRRSPTTLQGMNTTDYSILIETLASALKDVSSQPWLWNQSSEYDLPVSSSLPTQPVASTSTAESAAFPVPGSSSFVNMFSNSPTCMPPPVSPTSVPLPATPVSRSQSTIRPKSPLKEQSEEVTIDGEEVAFREMPALVLDNLNKLVDLLRPEEYAQCDHEPSSPVYSDEEGECETKEGASPATSSGSQSLLAKIPEETLTKILVMARTASEEMSCECGQPCTASKMAFQRWVLSLSTVSKSFEGPALQAAYGLTRIRSRSQISRLSRLLVDKPVLQGLISEIDIKVPTYSGSASNNPPSPTYLTGRSSRRRQQAFPWFGQATPQTVPIALPGMPAVKSDEDPATQLIHKLIDLTPGLARCELSVTKNSSYSYSMGGWPYSTEFMEKGLQNSLAAAPSLRSLTLRQVVDFGEIEAILLGCKTLEELRFEGGIDNLDGRDDCLEESHTCRLKSVYINNFEAVDIGEKQLCWILRPSIGNLKELEIATSVALGPGPGGQGNGQMFAPFSGVDFANLLVELGPTLTRLALKDSLGHAIGLGIQQTANPSLRVEPHNGVLDHALSFCTGLCELALDWSLAGTNFLTSVKPAPLTNLVLIGGPTNLDGKTFVKFIENDAEQLEKLSLVSFAMNQGASWSARDIRALRRLTEDRALQFEFATL